MKLRCIIVDDEEGARLILEDYIRRFEVLDLEAQFSNAMDAFHFLKQHKTDIIFLDIDLPEINGFALLDLVEQRPSVIFTTASSDHALNAFDSGAVDYLYKPIRFERFVKAIEKIIKFSPVKPAALPVRQIEVKADGKELSVNTAEVYYIQSLGNYLRIFCKNNTLVVLMTMNEITAKLGDAFVRVHKSYTVNSAHIKTMVNNTVVVNGTCLPVGKTYKKFFQEYLKATGRFFD